MIREQLLPLLMLSLAIPSGADASGRTERLSIADAVQESDIVLLVKKAKPPTRERTVFIPYSKAGKPQLAKMKTSFLRVEVVEVLRSGSGLSSSVTDKSLLRPGKTHTFKSSDLTRGRALRVVSSGSISNHRWQVRFLEDGTRKIMLYRRLSAAVDAEAFAKGNRFVFLGSYSVGYEALRGVGGSGLVSVKHLRKIRRLLKKR